jgi:hypothetical protein
MRILLLFAVVLTFSVRAMGRDGFELQELEFSSPGCWSNCPAFRLIFRPDRSIDYFASRFCKLSGAFHASLTPPQYDSLVTLVRAVHADSVGAEYDASYQDANSLYLYVTHNSWKVTIIDHTGGATPQLYQLYCYMYWLQNNLPWTRYPLGHPGVNDIDQLQTREDLVWFLDHKVKKPVKTKEILGTRPGENNGFPQGWDSAVLPNWCYRIVLHQGTPGKLVVDNDVVINGRDVWAVIGDERGNYTAYRIARTRPRIGRTMLVKVDTSMQHDMIRIRELLGGREEQVWLRPGLGGFVEVNYSVASMYPFGIQEIRFSDGGCKGRCPRFNLSIGEDTVAHYSDPDNPRAGAFHARLPAQEFEELKAMIGGLDTATLKPRYDLGFTDLPVYTLEISYNHGGLIRVVDSGGAGSYMLQNIYNRFSHWKESLPWQRD